MANWVARNSDMRWMVHGYGDPALIHTQPGAYTLVDVPGNIAPNPRTELYDPSSPTKKRAATAAEIIAYDSEQKDASVDAQLAGFDDELLEAILENLPAMIQEVQTGSFRRGLWRQRIRGRVKMLRRST